MESVKNQNVIVCCFISFQLALYADDVAEEMTKIVTEQPMKS